MPTRRFSTTSDRPMPFSAPSAFDGEQQVERAQALPVERHRDALLEVDRHLGLAVGRVLRRLRQLEERLLRPVPRVLEVAALVAEVPGVHVARVDVLLRDGPEVDAVGARVVDGVLARADVPHPPRGDHGELRGERLVGELEAHLVVALARAAVGHRVRAFLAGRCPPGSSPAAAGRSRCPGGTCPRRARPSAASGRGSRARTRSRASTRYSFEAPEAFALRSRPERSSFCPTSVQTATTSAPA